MKKLLLLLSIYTPLLLWGSKDSALRYSNAIYEKDIRTVKLENSSSGFALPTISLGETGSYKLEFDQLTGERDYYQYTLIHCDALWNPSGLQKNQYLHGNRGCMNMSVPELQANQLNLRLHPRSQGPEKSSSLNSHR